MLWPKFENDIVALNLAFTGTIKDEVIDKEEVSFYLLKYLLKNYLGLIIEKYKLNRSEIEETLRENDENRAILEVIEQIGRKRGALISGGKVDNKKVSNILLQDFREARIGKITLEKVEK